MALLTTITKIDPIYTYFSPSQNDARIFKEFRDKDKPDAFIELKGTHENIRLDGYLDFADNVVDNLTSTITMRATIKNPDFLVLPGTFVYVDIFINDKYKFLMIPPEVIFADQLGNFVYIEKDKKALRVDISTGYSTRHLVSVKTGLKDGDKVIVSSLVKLRNGLAVNPTDVSDLEGVKAILKKNSLNPSDSSDKN